MTGLMKNLSISTAILVTFSSVPVASAHGVPLPHAARKPRATVSAHYTVKTSGKVVLTVLSNARHIQVKTRTSNGAKKIRKRTLRHGRVTVRLGRPTKRLRVRTVSTRELASSGWITATRVPIQPKPRPAVEPQPTVLPTATPRPTATPTPTTSPAPAPKLTAHDLQRLSQLRIFFGHQSVGHNILDGVPGVYQAFGLASPKINWGLPQPGGSFGNADIGQNEFPSSKLDDFTQWITQRGAGSSAHVALMKLCYSDITIDTDVSAWFTAYRGRLAHLQSQYPGVVFLHATVPVTNWRTDENAVREQLNSRLRAEYGATGRLFDIAAVESTRTDGSRVTGTHDGTTYYSLNPDYTHDGGHLNEAGRDAAAREFLSVIANATD